MRVIMVYRKFVRESLLLEFVMISILIMNFLCRLTVKQLNYYLFSHYMIQFLIYKMILANILKVAFLQFFCRVIAKRTGMSKVLPFKHLGVKLLYILVEIRWKKFMLINGFYLGTKKNIADSQ